MKHINRTQLGEVGQMQAVIEQQQLENAVALGTGETEEVHRGIIHTHQLVNVSSLGRHQKVAMKGNVTAKSGGTKVKVAVGFFSNLLPSPGGS